MKKLKIKSTTKAPTAETFTKKLSKKVDFSDFKFSRTNSADNNKKKLDILNANSSRSSNYDNTPHQIPATMLTVVPPSASLDIRMSASSSYSSQSSPKSGETTNHTSPSCEDSSFSSNISTTSENFHHHQNKSSSHRLPSSSQTVSSLSSTSSGVSSNISSASSTTSEPPFADTSNLSGFSKPPSSSGKNSLQPQYVQQQHAISSRTSSSSNVNKKIAPKAVIDEDGDIEVEESKTLRRGAKFCRDMPQRSSMRLPSESSNWLQRQASERLSHRVMPSYQYGNKRISQYEQASTQQVYHGGSYQPAGHQQPFSNHLQQSQLAAAAAAAAAVILFIFFIFVFQ